MRAKILFICGALVLTACGSEKAPDKKGAAAAADSGVPAGQPGDQASRAAVDCGDVKGQTAPEGEAADDVLGIRRGMTEQQVKDILTCRGNYAVNSSVRNISLPSGGQMSQVSLNGDTGLDKLAVLLVGPTGAETVVQVARTVEYPEGKNLPVDAIIQEVSQKYGTFDAKYDKLNGLIVRSLDGQRLQPENSNYSTCSAHYLRTDRAIPCRDVVSYRIEPYGANPSLARRFTVTITSHQETTQMRQAVETRNASDLEKARQAAETNGIEL